MNSAALRFYKEDAALPPESRPTALATAYFAGGCFWGIEDQFQQVPGVIAAVSGYQGGHVANPGYNQVSRGNTGHAETVRVTFDPKQGTETISDHAYVPITKVHKGKVQKSTRHSSQQALSLTTLKQLIQQELQSPYGK